MVHYRVTSSLVAARARGGGSAGLAEVRAAWTSLRESPAHVCNPTACEHTGTRICSTDITSL